MEALALALPPLSPPGLERRHHQKPTAAAAATASRPSAELPPLLASAAAFFFFLRRALYREGCTAALLNQRLPAGSGWRRLGGEQAAAATAGAWGVSVLLPRSAGLTFAAWAALGALVCKGREGRAAQGVQEALELAAALLEVVTDLWVALVAVQLAAPGLLRLLGQRGLAGLASGGPPRMLFDCRALDIPKLPGEQ